MNCPVTESKSVWEFESRNLSLAEIEGREEEDEEPRQVIGFLEGTDFLGAIVKKLKEKKKKKEQHSKEDAQERRKKKCNAW